MPPMVFYWIHLTWMIKNRCLLKELYEELKEIEYSFCENGISWFYKATWRTKYLSKENKQDVISKITL
ncbi:unnamed protein product [Nezara viridula]|uniref:Uncharacterized protein n=1 Tax=Nezara viridula TaxID=85310 RepID=A0A9P0HL64_NEZVI|nr:unnamed protein product [Nezara viridula]